MVMTRLRWYLRQIMLESNFNRKFLPSVRKTSAEQKRSGIFGFHVPVEPIASCAAVNTSVDRRVVNACLD